MSIPESEIETEEQDELRALLDGTAFSRLAESIRDRIVRALHARAGNAAVVAVYRSLLETLVTGDAAGLPDLSEERQGRVLDVLPVLAGQSDSLGLRLAVDAIAACSYGDTIKDAALDVVAIPLRRSREAAASEPSPTFRNEAVRRVLSRWVPSHPRRMSTLRQTLRHATFDRMTDEQRTRALTVVAETHLDGLSSFTALLEPADARLRASGAAAGTALVLSTDKDGTTLLDHLERLATGDPYLLLTVNRRRLLFDPASPPPEGQSVHVDPHALRPIWNAGDDDGASVPEILRSRALGDILCEIDRPDQYLNQFDRNTCPVTCVLHRLAWQQPAEYARIGVDLVLEAETTLRNGDPIRAPSDALTFDDSARSVIERLSQSAMMVYARLESRDRRGRPVTYRNAVPTGFTSTDAWSDRQVGLIGVELVRIMNATLLGGPFSMRWQNLPATLVAHFRAHPDVPVLTGIAGEHVVQMRAIVPPSTTGPVSPLGATDIVEREPQPGAYYWNPWGAALLLTYQGFPVTVHVGTVEPPSWGTRRDGHAWRHRTVDDTRGLQFMPWSELTHLVRDIYLPTVEP